MSTTSQHMGLKIPDGSDPFLRTDFVQNYNTLDKYTGNWICTSSTRPAWDAPQAGMCITETDTRRTLMWTGTTWREMLYGPAIWWGSLRPGSHIGDQAVVTYVVGTFTVNRPGTLLGFTTTELGLPGNGRFQCNTRVMIDGAVANWDGDSYGEFSMVNWNNTATAPALDSFGDTVTSMGVRNISAGTHSIGIMVSTVGTDGGITSSGRITSVRAMAMFVNGTDR